jgi:hypothetical protein
MSSSTRKPDDDLMPEADFSNGIRGKHYQAYRQGHSVTIHKTDGTTETQYFTLADGAIMLDPDVRAYFQDNDAVNQALRALIPAGDAQSSP